MVCMAVDFAHRSKVVLLAALAAILAICWTFSLLMTLSTVITVTRIGFIVTFPGTKLLTGSDCADTVLVVAHELDWRFWDSFSSVSLVRAMSLLIDVCCLGFFLQRVPCTCDVFAD